MTDSLLAVLLIACITLEAGRSLSGRVSGARNGNAGAAHVPAKGMSGRGGGPAVKGPGGNDRQGAGEDPLQRLGELQLAFLLDFFSEQCCIPII